MNFKKMMVLAAWLLPCAYVSAQNPYQQDRVYTSNQVSNTVSVIDPASQTLLGEIVLGKPQTEVLSPLYKGQALVHGLGYSAKRKLLAVVSIGSNSVTFINTQINSVLKTVYVGRSPHEATFNPAGTQVWVSIRGEAYISVIDAATLAEIKRVKVADGPGMVSFAPDGKLAYVCSSFTPQLDVVNTQTYQVVKSIPVVSPFSPNIFCSADGKWIAMTHKDVGKTTIINTKTMQVQKVLNTGAISNHVTFTISNNIPLMLVTVGGENKLKVFKVNEDFKLIDSLKTGALPHGIWPSADGRYAYIGLENDDAVQVADLTTMQIVKTIPIGQCPQALIYATNAGTLPQTGNLTALNILNKTDVIVLKDMSGTGASGNLNIRNVGLINLITQDFRKLKPNTDYTLALTNSDKAPYQSDHIISAFKTDEKGAHMGNATDVVKKIGDSLAPLAYKNLVLLSVGDQKLVLIKP